MNWGEEGEDFGVCVDVVGGYKEYYYYYYYFCGLLLLL